MQKLKKLWKRLKLPTAAMPNSSSKSQNTTSQQKTRMRWDLSQERVCVVPCLLLILKTLIAFQKMFPQNCKKVKSTNKEHHEQDQSQNCDSILPNQSIVRKEGLHIEK